MHDANRRVWEGWASRYPRYFRRARVLEIGAYDVNGSIRDYFSECAYVGVDWRPGPGVDIASLGHEVTFPAGTLFDVVVSASTLEHDPYWPQTLDTVTRLLLGDGALFLTWGTPRCAPHGTSPDGVFHPLAPGLVLRHLTDAGFHIAEFFYEPGSGGHYACVAAFRDPEDAGGLLRLEVLEVEDRC